MTNHREAREVLRQMRDFLPWLVQQRQYMGIVPKEPWDPKHLQAGPLPLAITKTILNLLRSSSQEEIPSTRCEGFKHDIDDLRQLGIGSEQNIQALVLDALDTDNAAEAISALPLVLNNAANISDKLVAVFKSPKVLHHIKVSASIRLCSPHWGSIDDDKSNTLHMSINESVVGSILGLLELSYSDAVIPALFDVSAFYFRRSRKSHNNELERLRRGTRTATADMPLLEKGTAKMANQDIDYICGLIRRAMRELALPPSGDDELPAETPTETTAESDFEDLTLKLQSADATFITKSMDTVDLEKFEPSIKRYWGYVASALGSDTELLSRFVELLKDDKLHKVVTGNHLIPG
ncbi:hypothetical protein NEOLEDRAFT_539706 [Neolentinus lepideus HHB14362 ss-1]|uniref:Uncharacterized protein n=1 Tax=Neolentinus lepideus HHB14362 ss-1 TaxID=1314782 RepID=A0A165RBN5_9AGAM|nr:hypothetical protein NEOLEDRAFT_539706 [Neolentinus lepideus HHB14362 ss-1]